MAPDLPGFGFTVVPSERGYVYTFENLAKTIEAFVDIIGLKRYALHAFITEYDEMIKIPMALYFVRGLSTSIVIGNDFLQPQGACIHLGKTSGQDEDDYSRSKEDIPVSCFAPGKIDRDPSSKRIMESCTIKTEHERLTAASSRAPGTEFSSLTISIYRIEALKVQVALFDTPSATEKETFWIPGSVAASRCLRNNGRGGNMRVERPSFID